MQAWQVVKHGEPKDVMELDQKAVPEPGPGEVRIVVKAVALGLPDVFMCRGTYAFNPQIPFTPGQEVVGIVTAIGEGVDLAVGARVIATTSFIQGNGGSPSRPLRRSVRPTVFRMTCPTRMRLLSSYRFKRHTLPWPDAGNYCGAKRYSFMVERVASDRQRYRWAVHLERRLSRPRRVQKESRHVSRLGLLWRLILAQRTSRK
jgi:Alcohol dehydrogenase GroES-like domain